jgi:hypothetical protein
MARIQIYLPTDELVAVRDAASRSGRSVSGLIREAIRKQLTEPPARGPVALWDGEPRRTSIDHSDVPDEI